MPQQRRFEFVALMVGCAPGADISYRMVKARALPGMA
jgi:hypothetical protein